jgi:hypothetical protein
VQLDLVRSGRSVPVTDGAASRNPGPATPAQCVAAQIAQAGGTRQHRPRRASRPLSPGTQGAGGIEIITPETGIALVFEPIGAANHVLSVVGQRHQQRFASSFGR